MIWERVPAGRERVYELWQHGVAGALVSKSNSTPQVEEHLLELESGAHHQPVDTSIFGPINIAYDSLPLWIE